MEFSNVLAQKKWRKLLAVVDFDRDRTTTGYPRTILTRVGEGAVQPFYLAGHEESRMMRQHLNGKSLDTTQATDSFLGPPLTVEIKE